jgi:hypothetical protein
LEENDEEQITVSDLVTKMTEELAACGSTEEPYSVKYMKQRLLEHYGEKIVITQLGGRENVVTFRTTASSILQEYYSAGKHKYDDEEEKIRLIVTAGKLIRNDAKLLEFSHLVYPTTEDMSSIDSATQYLPQSLLVLLQTIIGKTHTKKVASIGHAIVQAARPRVVVAPLQLGLAVQMHHHFGSRFLIDSLYQHGFCSSYSEVQRYEHSAATSRAIETTVQPGQFVQYAADNVDHDIRTLDGKGTFHGIGMIGAVTPGMKTTRVVSRTATPKSGSLRSGLNILLYKPSGSITSLNYTELKEMKTTATSSRMMILCGDYHHFWKLHGLPGLDS